MNYLLPNRRFMSFLGLLLYYGRAWSGVGYNWKKRIPPLMMWFSHAININWLFGKQIDCSWTNYVTWRIRSENWEYIMQIVWLYHAISFLAFFKVNLPMHPFSATGLVPSVLFSFDEKLWATFQIKCNQCRSMFDASNANRKETTNILTLRAGFDCGHF